MMKQDKGRVVAIMDKAKYYQKCLMILENGNFKTLDFDLTKKTEEKIQRILRRIKNRISQYKYLRLYADLGPLSFMEQLVHEISENDTVDELPIRSIVSNFGTATYDLAKYLGKLWST